MATNFPSTPPRTSTLLSSRWVALCIATMLIHLLAINWVGDHLDALSPEDQENPVITASLQAIPPTIAPVLATTSYAAKPTSPHRATHKIKPVAASTVNSSAISTSLAADANAVTPDTSTPDTNTPSTSALTDATATPPSIPEAAAPSAQDSDAPHYNISPPPSVELKYDVVRVPHEGTPLSGHGTISWQSDGNNYAILGDAGVLFISALTFKSEGVIDKFGISPVLYSEKRFRRSETNTHFQHERNTISFSASETSYPRKGGEQDRASIIWQLAGIGRGDPEKFIPDAEIGIFVAGVRDGEVWNIRVIGKEEIVVDSGKMTAWHVVRAPRPGSYDQKIDIWLAPDHEWYPVKIRYTETSGDYLDMSLSDMRITAPH